MIVPNSLAAASGGPALSGAGRKTDQDQSDQHDFGAELGALLATMAPTPDSHKASAVACGGAQAAAMKASAGGAEGQSAEMTGTVGTNSDRAGLEPSPAQARSQTFVELTPGAITGTHSLLQAAPTAPNNLAKPTAPVLPPAASVDLIATGGAAARDAVQKIPDTSSTSGPERGKAPADDAPSTAQVPLASQDLSSPFLPISPTSGRTELKVHQPTSSRSDSERPGETPTPSRDLLAGAAEHRADASTGSETAHPATPAQAAPAKGADITPASDPPAAVHEPTATVAPLASNPGTGAIAATHPAHPIASVTSIAAPRPPSDIPSIITPARTAVLKVDLADGATAHARVSERAGVVDVRVVTNNSPIAQHVADQFGGLRRTLDGAGLRLEHAGVSYRDDGRSGHREQRQDQTPAQPPQQSGEKQFAEYEVQR